MKLGTEPVTVSDEEPSRRGSRTPLRSQVSQVDLRGARSRLPALGPRSPLPATTDVHEDAMAPPTVPTFDPPGGADEALRKRRSLQQQLRITVVEAAVMASEEHTDTSAYGEATGGA